jgi:TldD protein
MARGDGEVALRTWPADLDEGYAAAGYELLSRADLAGHAPALADEALALLSAPVCPVGQATSVPARRKTAIIAAINSSSESGRSLGGTSSWTMAGCSSSA